MPFFLDCLDGYFSMKKDFIMGNLEGEVIINLFVSQATYRMPSLLGLVSYIPDNTLREKNC